MTMKTSRISFRTTEAIRKTIERCAAERGISISAVISIAVTSQYGAGRKAARTRRRKAA